MEQNVYKIVTKDTWDEAEKSGVFKGALVDLEDGHWKWEEARGGKIFPHLYTDLPTHRVNWIKSLPVNNDGHHIFPIPVP